MGDDTLAIHYISIFVDNGLPSTVGAVHRMSCHGSCITGAPEAEYPDVHVGRLAGPGASAAAP